jgi:hypothetical protein
LATKQYLQQTSLPLKTPHKWQSSSPAPHERPRHHQGQGIKFGRKPTVAPHQQRESGSLQARHPTQCRPQI